MAYKPFIEPNKTQFGQQTFAESTQQINLKSIYGISALRDNVTETGSATITNVTGEYKLTTTASGADNAALESVERGRYIAGQDAVVGIGARQAGTVSGSISCRWGYYDANNGFGFGQDATGVFIFDRDGGSETKVYQSNWNGDVLDGTGQSGETLDVSNGYIYQITFAWYGYGSIEFSIFTYDSDTKEQKEVVVHRIRKDGQVSIQDPNLPIRAEVDNGGTATAFDSLYIGGRQFSTSGKFNAFKRITSDRRIALAGVGTTAVPLVSMRRKSTFESVAVKVKSISIITSANIIVELRTGASLTGASYVTPTNYTASETAVEADRSATAVTGGNVLFTRLVSASGSGNNSVGSASETISDIGLNGLEPVTVVIRTISGTATVTCVLSVSEEW